MENRSGTCNMCGRAGHIARFCTEQNCGKCNRRGHQDRDCPLRGQVSNLRIWMPLNTEVRVAVTQKPIREFPGIGANLQLLPNALEMTMNGSVFSSKDNKLKIQYGGAESIVIALQDAGSEAETIIQLRPNRVGGVNIPLVRICAKYAIENRILQERIDRLATGSR